MQTWFDFDRRSLTLQLSSGFTI